MPYPSQVDKATEKYPPEVRIVAMRVGGKAPSAEDVGEEYHKKGRGKAKGLIEYKDVTNKHPELVAQYTKHFQTRAQQLPLNPS
jgi:hypothetical protein